MTEFNVETAMETYHIRIEENKDLKQIDNRSLYAGSPMYFYCRKCRTSTDVLPESFITRPKTICKPCKILEDHGLI